MNFVSFAYIVFLALAGLCYFLLPKATRPFWLLACSCVFYLYDAANAPFLVLLLAMTLMTYLAGLLLDKIDAAHKLVRILVLAVTLILCFAALVYYKYASFFFGKSLSIAVPLGISYFTFSATGYFFDIYRGKIHAEKNLLYYALFVTFFPNIVAGPIERAGNMIPQFKTPQPFDYNRVCGGLFRILWGFFKKLVVANMLLGIIKPVFRHMENYSGPMLVLAALLFAYQLYIDFSALSDIAIGSAAVFGFTVMENFKRPLAACSITDLWRRWHISLSTWFRDYLYFPLGGSRKGKLRAHLNQLIVFAVSGLWHGASWGYLLWGFLNGVFLCVGKETAELRSRLEQHNPLYAWKPLKHFLQACITYLLFAGALVFFCAELYCSKDTGWTGGLYLYAHLFSGWGTLFDGTLLATLAKLGFEGVRLWVLLGSIVTIEGFEYLQIPTNTLIRQMPVYLRWPLYYILCLVIYFWGELGVSSFVYQIY
ncbi:MAG: MBOAT family O-acyltransferase [Ruthenibacterium sp.]